MQFARPAGTPDARPHRSRRPARVARRDPRRFGRRPPPAAAIARPQPSISNDLKLFAVTFLGGFLFVSILIG